MTDKAQKVDIVVGVDNSAVKPGLAQSEQDFKKFGATVEQQAGRASKSIDSLGATSQETSAKLSRSQQAYVANLQRVVAAEEAGGRNTVEYQRKLAALRNVPSEFSEPLLKQLEAIQKAQDATGKGQIDFQKQLSATGLTAKQTAAALRQVPAQFTDIVVSLAGGTNPLTVLLQQGGQLKDVFGGVGVAAQALGSYIIGLVNPFTTLAAAAAALALAYKAGSDERDAFVQSLILTGEAVGTSVTGLQAYAKAISQTTGVTQGLAAESLTLAVNSGLTAENLSTAAGAAARFSKVSGVGIEKTIKQFADLQNEPLKASLKLNETTNFLTRASYEQIRAFEEQGRTVEAARVAVEAYAAAINNHSDKIEENLGRFEQAWRDVKEAASDAVDAAKNFGRWRDDSAEAELARLEELQRRLKDADGSFGFFGRGDQLELENLLKRENSLRAAVVLEREATAERARSAEAVKLRAKFDQDGLKYLDDEAKKRAALVTLQGELQRAVDVGAIKGEEALRRLVEAETALSKKKGEDTRGAELNLRIAQIEAAFQREVDAAKQAGQVLEAQRTAGTVGDRQYFAEKARLATLVAQIEIDSLDSVVLARQSSELGIRDQLENRKKLAELDTKRLKLVTQLATDTKVLGIQEDGRDAARARSIKAATDALEEYQDTVRKGYAERLSLTDRGDAVRQQLDGELQIRKKYADEIVRLQKQQTALPEGDDRRRQFDDLIEAQRKYLAIALSDWDDYYAELRKKQDDWRAGARRSLENYAADAANVAKASEDMFTKAFKGTEDALVQFTTTGKWSVSDMVDSMLADLARLAYRKTLMGPLAAAVGSLLDPGAVSTGSVTGADMDVFSQWAKGGVPGANLSNYRNGVYDRPQMFAFAKGAGVFGEAGPEAIMPLTRTPDGNLGVRAVDGGNSNAVTITYAPVISVDSRTDRADIVRMIDGMLQNSQAQLVDQLRRKGSI